MKPLRIAIAGFGGFGRFVLKALQTMDGQIEVKAVFDEVLIEEDTIDGISIYSNWQAMVKQESLDAVWIVTPPSSHYELAIRALSDNLHVIIEKPLALKASDARAIAVHSKRTGKVAMVNFMQRYNPILNLIHSLSINRNLGELEHFSILNFAQDQTLPEDHWFWDPSVSGGIILEHSVHFIDIVHWFLDHNNYLGIDSWCDSRKPGIQDRSEFSVKYNGGCIARHYHSFSRPAFFEKTTFQIHFSLAEFNIEGWIPQTCSFNILGDSAMEERLDSTPECIINHRSTVPGVPVRGIEYPYDRVISGSFNAGVSKEGLYRKALIDITKDFIEKIGNPKHSLKVSLSDGIKAVEIAEIASSQCTNNP